MAASNHKARSWIARILLLTFAILVALLMGEICLRGFAHQSSMLMGADITVWLENQESKKPGFVADAELGFHPNLDGRRWDEFGRHRPNRKQRAENLAASKSNKTPAKVLFVGDSVTSRAKICNAIQAEFKDAGMQWWNGGVESYNTLQEAIYYERYLQESEPDHVILTLHNNDFGITPAGFFTDDGFFTMHAPGREPLQMRARLFRYSHLYRLLFKWRLQNWMAMEHDEASKLVQQGLRQLRDKLKAQGVKLWVLLHPILLEKKDWQERQVQNHQSALTILQDLNIWHVDLMPALEAALADGKNVQVLLGDTWHPNAEVSRYFAQHAAQAGLLQ